LQESLPSSILEAPGELEAKPAAESNSHTNPAAAESNSHTNPAEKAGSDDNPDNQEYFSDEEEEGNAATTGEEETDVTTYKLTTTDAANEDISRNKDLMLKAAVHVKLEQMLIENVIKRQSKKQENARRKS
jgi:hypothetical protein